MEEKRQLTDDERVEILNLEILRSRLELYDKLLCEKNFDGERIFSEEWLRKNLLGDYLK